MLRIGNYINGALREPLDGKYLESIDPATGSAVAAVPDSAANDVGDAVAAAADAFPRWAATPAQERCRALLRIADLLEAEQEELAHLECVDTGKPLKLARSVDIPRAVSNFRFFATAILHGATQAFATDQQAINYTLRQPRGVAGLIAPWNLPLYLLSWKVAPALAAGNTAVAKPSEVTPMTAHRLSELCCRADLPPGVLNIVHGTGPQAGAALVAHHDVHTISFTGGTATGRRIAQAAAPAFKKIALEMGGKNPNIIFADADFDAVVPASLRSSFANQGQICLCGSRIFVEQSRYQEFMDRFLAGARGLVVGDPLEEKTDQGAVVSQAQLDKIRFYVDLARQEGGRLLCGGQEPGRINERCRNGFFFEPTVIADLAVDCRVNQEEIFGPVVTVTPFTSEDEVIAWANMTPYGLSASVWTADLSRAHRLASRIDCGTVWANCWMLRDLRVPFGGMKQSGVGREGGEEALRFFTEPKTVCIAISPSA